MKKLRGIMAILAATALIFGTVACSDGGGNDNNNNKTPTDQSDPTTGGGGSGTSDPTTGGGGSQGGDEGGSTTVDPVSYCWNFQTTTTTEVKAVDAGGDYQGKYVLSEDYEYASTPSGMILTMGKGDAAKGFVYNKIAPDQTLGSSTVYYVNGSNTDSTAGATIGAIEPAGDLVSLKNVQGPFTVKAYVQGNSSSDKTDRYGYIKIAGEEVYAPNKAQTTLPAAGQILTYTYEASDKVDVVIGCAKYMRIYDVVVTTAAAQDQSTAETNAASMTLSSDKESAKVGSKVTWTLTANNMDVPSTVDVYVDGSGTPFITGAAVTDGKYEMTVKEDWLLTDEDDDPIETTVKVFVKSGDVSSNKVTITFVPADNIPLYSDLTPVNFVSDGYTAEELNYIFAMTDAELETLVAGRYTDAECTIPVTEGYEGDIYIKLNKTKDELKAMIDAAIAAATKYTVTFDANGGAFAADATTSVEVASGLSVTSDQLATISEPAKTDYTFIGWATTADATEAADLSTVTISGATTLYAVWKSNIVTAVWDWTAATQPIVAETADATASTTLQNGATGYATVNAGGNNVSIVVAATGKLYSRAANGDAQFNNGTVLKVPVSAGSVLYVYTKAGTYAVNGVKSQAAETTYSAATSAGYVELKATGNDYIYKISVTGLKVTDDFTAQASLTAVPATSLTLSETEALDKIVEDSFTLSAAVAPATRTSAVVWTVEGDAVAIVSQDDLDAKFTAVAAGTATIKATCDEQVATLTVNVTAASANAFKVTYFDSELTAFSAAGVSSNESVVTAAAAVASAGTESFGTVNNVKSHFYQIDSVTCDKDATIITVTMTLTAVQKMKIVKVTGECAESGTGNISRSLKVGTADAVSLGTGKNITINAENINQTVEAGSTIDVVITTTATAAASKKTFKQLYKDIIITGEIVE